MSLLRTVTESFFGVSKTVILWHYPPLWTTSVSINLMNISFNKPWSFTCYMEWVCVCVCVCVCVFWEWRMGFNDSWRTVIKVPSSIIEYQRVRVLSTLPDASVLQNACQYSLQKPHTQRDIHTHTHTPEWFPVAERFVRIIVLGRGEPWSQL